MRILQFSQIVSILLSVFEYTKPRESVELRDVRVCEIVYPTSYGGGYKNLSHFGSNRITLDRINLFYLVSYLILFKGIVYTGSD